jgi:ClpX C4-type zinc finger
MWRKHKWVSTTLTSRCSFCGKQQTQVERLIAGRRVFICSEWVDLCQQIFKRDERASNQRVTSLTSKVAAQVRLNTSQANEPSFMMAFSIVYRAPTAPTG